MTDLSYKVALYEHAVLRTPWRMNEITRDQAEPFRVSEFITVGFVHSQPLRWVNESGVTFIASRPAGAMLAWDEEDPAWWKALDVTVGANEPFTTGPNEMTMGWT